MAGGVGGRWADDRSLLPPKPQRLPPAPWWPALPPAGSMEMQVSPHAAPSWLRAWWIEVVIHGEWLLFFLSAHCPRCSSLPPHFGPLLPVCHLPSPFSPTVCNFPLSGRVHRPSFPPLVLLPPRLMLISWRDAARLVRPAAPCWRWRLSRRYLFTLPLLTLPPPPGRLLGPLSFHPLVERRHQRRKGRQHSAAAAQRRWR